MDVTYYVGKDRYDLCLYSIVGLSGLTAYRLKDRKETMQDVQFF